MAPDHAVLTFQNTGREHERTLEFVRNVGDAIAKDIVWLEFRPPLRLGDAPKKFLFERVNFDTASRNGEPFDEFMRAINAYREACENPPLAPFYRGRICTTYLKHRVLDHYVRSLGISEHDRLIGLRADEPDRVRRLRSQETRTKMLYAPLYDAGVTKGDVIEFWRTQPFDLGIEEYEGNCDGCFLKDQSDVSRSLGARPDAIRWWQDKQDMYPRFGGELYPSYAMLAGELPIRLAIESAFRDGRQPVDDGRLDPKRFRLVMLQERRRFHSGPAQFSCACESSMDSEEDDRDEAETDRDQLRIHGIL